MGGTDTMQLCVSNTIIAIVLEYGSEDMDLFIAKLDSMAETSERNCLQF